MSQAYFSQCICLYLVPLCLMNVKLPLWTESRKPQQPQPKTTPVTPEDVHHNFLYVTRTYSKDTVKKICDHFDK